MSKLHKACENGYLEQVTSLLTSENINTQNTYGETPLFLASKYAHLDIVKILVSREECDVNIPDNEGNTPLHRTSKHTVVQLLVAVQRCQLNTQNIQGQTPLHIASNYNEVNSVKVLVSREECDLNVPDEQGNTPLHGACMYGHYSTVKILTADQRCQSVNTQNKDGETPLHIASKTNSRIVALDIFKVLVSREECDLSIPDEQGNTPLHTACKRKDYFSSVVRFLVADQRCQVNTQNKHGETPLHIAFKYGSMMTVEDLLSREECDVNIPDEQGNTPLHTACKRKDYFSSVVRFLVADQRCQVNTQNKGGETPLHIASKTNSRIVALDIVKVLVSRKECDLNIPDEQGNTPLHTACKHNFSSVVRFLVADQRCQSVNTQNKGGETPLHIASKTNSRIVALDIVKVLVSREECDLNIPDEQGNTPLHTACKHKFSSAVQFLVADERCHSVNTRNKGGETPLHIASKNGSVNTVMILVSSEDCEFNIPDGKGNIPLHGACMYGHYSTVEILTADQRCPLNAQNEEGETALHIASKLRDLCTVKFLVKSDKCNLNIADESGNTPLHSACKHGDTKIISLLLDRKCSTNIPNKLGETAEYIPLNENGDCLLHIACRWGDVSIVRYLIIDQRCNPNSTNASGSTPLHIASECCNLDVIEVLVSRKDCDLNIPDQRGNTPLHLACHIKALSIVKLLSEKGCSTSIPNSNGETAQEIPLNEDGDCLLHFACLWGDVAIVRHLITNERCNLNITNASGSTPLHTASKHDHLDVIKVIVSRKECDLNIQDNRGNTPLHTTCKYMHAHHSTVQFLVADPRCHLNAKNSDMNTPMHLACIRKTLSIVKLLLEKRCSTDIPNNKYKTAQEIPLNEDGDYLLHIACQWGDVDMIKYLVTDQKCDPNVLNKYHLTPLLATIKLGKPSVATALLQYAKCDLSHHDEAGNTALHLACISGQTQPEMAEVAKSLINSVDPLCVNSAGQTPIELTTNYDIIRAISHFTKCRTKHSIQTYINLFIVGNPETGKSTLVKAICKEAGILWKFLPKGLRRVKNVAAHTAGIIPTTFQSKTFGNTVLYDLAGQIEYYTSHAAVIKTTVISTPPAFTVVVNMSEREEKISETLRYWWSFINNHAAQASAPPHVILVGSHADKVKARGESVQVKMSQVSALLKHLPTSFYFAGHIALDCRDPASRELQIFCSLVNNSCCELRRTADVDLRCHVLYAFLLDKFQGRVACTVSDIATIIKESDTLLPQNPDSLIPLISTLSDKGLLLLVEDNGRSEHSWVILQKQTLLGEINGTIFAPKNFNQHKKDLSSSTGVVPLLKLKSEFPDYNPTMILKFLTHLEFCFKVDDHETLDLLKDEVNEENIPQTLSDEYYFFPSLVSIENPLQVWEQDDVMICQTAWLYRCIRHDQFLTTHFLHVLILRLAFSFALQLHPGDYHEDSLALRRRCSVWKRGIGWLNRVPIETVVEVGLLKQSVSVMMRCPKGEEVKCTQLRSKVIQKVLEAKDEHCKAVEMFESFIHPADVKYPCSHNAEDLKYYSLSEIATAVAMGEAKVLDNRGRNPFPIKDLLLLDPNTGTSSELLSELFGTKHSLDKKVHCQVLQKLSEATPQFSLNQEVRQENPSTSQTAVAQERECVGPTTQEVTLGDISRHSTPLPAMTQERGQVGEATQELTKDIIPQHSTKPTLPELLKFTCSDGTVVSIPVEVATKYVQFGTFLLDDRNGSRVKIMARKHHYDAEQINIEILQEWLTGRGKQPVTWATLVEVLHDIELSTLAGDISTSKCHSEQ